MIARPSRRLVLGAALASFPLLLPARVRAHPRVTPLRVVLASPHVVLARVRSGQTIDVIRALRGNLRGTITTRVGTGRANFDAGTVLVAFLSSTSSWSYFGRLNSAVPPDESPVRLGGFLDTGNAHIVSAGVLSLADLTALLRGRPLPQRRHTGAIDVVSPDGRSVVASSLVMEVDAAFGVRLEREPVVLR